MITQSYSAIPFMNGQAGAVIGFPWGAAAVEDVKVGRLVDGKLTAVPSSAYTITLTGDEGGNVTLLSPLAGQHYIYRETGAKQLVSISNQTAYNADVVEGVWDKLTRILQEIKYNQSLGIEFPFGTDGPLRAETPLPGAFPIWDETGKILINGPDGSAIASAQGYAEAANAAALEAAATLLDIKLAIKVANNLDSLLASTDVGVPVGTILLTNKEGYAFEVVSSSPDLTTEGGVMLRVLPDAAGNVSDRQFGLKGDGTDLAFKIAAVVERAAVNGWKLNWTGRSTYNVETLSVGGSKRVIWRADTGPVTFVSTKTAPDTSSYDADYAFKFAGHFVGSTASTANIAMGTDVVSVASNAVYSVGDLLEVRATRLIETDHRGQAREGQLCEISRLQSNGTGLVTAEPLQHFFPRIDTVSGTIATVTNTREMVLSAGINRNERDMLIRMEITSGLAAGQVRYITGWNNTTKVARFDGRQSAWPAGIMPGNSFILKWETSVNHIRPIHVDIRGDFRFTRERTTDATAGDYGFRGLEILYAKNAHVEITEVSGFSDTGIRFRGCYRPKLIGGSFRFANRSYAEWDGTGYGVSINQCWRALVEGAIAGQCRRGFDVIGAQGISHFCQFKNCRTIGGGLTYAGEIFFPNGLAKNSGIGSHGAAWGTVYEECEAVDTHNGFRLRGRSEKVSGFTHLGTAEIIGGLTYGGGHVIDGLRYEDRFSEVGNGAATRYQLAGSADKRAYSLIEIDLSTYRGQLPTTLLNMTANQVRTSAVSFVGTGTIKNVAIGNVVVHAAPAPGDAAFRFIQVPSLRQASGLLDLGGNRYSLNGAAYATASFLNYQFEISQASGEFMELDKPRTLVATIDNNSVLKIPISSAVARISLFDKNPDRIYRASGMLLYAGRNLDYDPNAATNKVGIDVSNIVLTGSTGAVNKVTISLRPVGGEAALYIENRLGLTIYPVIDIMAIP